jgi:small GTP-binding protein
MSTIGVDFKVKDLQLGGKNVRVQIWDTAGQERFRNITNSYYKGANGIVVVYDVTNRQSFETVSTWIEEISKKASLSTVNVIIANKIDMVNHRVVSTEEGEALASTLNLPYFETSAKDDNGVTQVFEFMTSKILTNLQASSNHITPSNVSVLSRDKKDKKEKKCC